MSGDVTGDYNSLWGANLGKGSTYRQHTHEKIFEMFKNNASQRDRFAYVSFYRA